MMFRRAGAKDYGLHRKRFTGENGKQVIAMVNHCLSMVCERKFTKTLWKMILPEALVFARHYPLWNVTRRD